MILIFYLFYLWNTIVTYFRNTLHFNQNTNYFDQKLLISVEILGISNQKFRNTTFFTPWI